MTAAVPDVMSEALAHHEAGRLNEAEPLYGVAIERQPANADAWHLLGRISLHRGECLQAAARVMQAIRLSPATPAFHSTLGEVLAASGRARDAKLCFQKALLLDPGFVPALVNLGNSLQNEGNYADACLTFGRAIQVDPSCIAALNNLGNALRAEGNLAEAVECYREALRLDPSKPESAVNLAGACLQLCRYEDAEAWARRALAASPGLAAALSNLSVALLNQGKLLEAEDAARQAVSAAPSAAHLYSNLGSVLLQRKCYEEAASACNQALALRPDYPEAMTNLGVALQFDGRLEEAAAQCQAVLRLRPELTEAWTNLGSVRQQQGRNRDALAAFEQALERNRDHAKARFCRSLSLLAMGRLREGFAEYESRWKVLANAPGPAPRAWKLPAWDGTPLAGRTILLFAEQGLGDTLQFARYIPLVAQRGGKVLVECQPRAAPLIASVAGVDRVVTPADDLPPADVQAAMMSLPHLLGTTLETIPSQTPYLRTPSSHRLKPTGDIRVGLAWAGNPEHSSDRRRSVSLAILEPWRAIPGIAWYNLHVGAKTDAEAHETGGWVRPILTPDGGLPELAALIGELDLIISVDTMAAHLAGALGRPVWTLLAHAADWRWFEDREDTPWYPSMRLFRQPSSGDWNSVLGLVDNELRQLVSRKLPKAFFPLPDEDS